MATTNPVIMPIIRQVFPSLMAQQIVGVQPMSVTGGHIFTMRIDKTRFNSLYNDPNVIKFHKKYKFSRAKWYVVEFDIDNYSRVRDWCTEHFGPHPRRADAWSRWDHRYETKIYFRDEDDAILFKLTWGENASS